MAGREQPYVCGLTSLKRGGAMLAGEDVSGRVARLPVEALNVDEDEVRQAATLAEATNAGRECGGGTASPGGAMLRSRPARAGRRRGERSNPDRAAAFPEAIRGRERGTVHNPVRGFADPARP